MIRELVYSDLASALEVIRAGFATVAGDFGVTQENAPGHPSFMKLEELQRKWESGYLMFGLYDENQLAGFIALSSKDGSTFELHHLAVLPGFRHKGYGKQLLEFCKTKVAELHGSKIIISIVEEHTVLKNWYAANGFIHKGIKKFPPLPFRVGFMEWDIEKMER